MTTLHYAIKLGDIHAVNLLIANGADVNSRDLSGVCRSRSNKRGARRNGIVKGLNLCNFPAEAIVISSQDGH
jgi:hypothetical protein